jgi:cell division protein ZapA
MENQENILKVNIFGTEYPLKSSANIQYVRKVSDYVDNKMKEIQKAKPSRPLHQIAILAAMNIADELFQNRDIDKNKRMEFEGKIAGLSNKLEQGILTILKEDQS